MVTVEGWLIYARDGRGRVLRKSVGERDGVDGRGRNGRRGRDRSRWRRSGGGRARSLASTMHLQPEEFLETGLGRLPLRGALTGGA